MEQERIRAILEQNESIYLKKDLALSICLHQLPPLPFSRRVEDLEDAGRYKQAPF